MTESIKQLARLCAMKNLDIAQACSLFDALYRADALALSGGNVTRAAKLAGIARGSMSRQIHKKTACDPDPDTLT